MERPSHISLSATARLLGVDVARVHRLARAGQLGDVIHPPVPGKPAAVPVEAIERHARRTFSAVEIRRTLAPPRVRRKVPAPLAIQIETAQLAIVLQMIEGFEHQQRDGEIFTREQVLAIVEHNLGLRDLQWLALQKRQMNQQMPDSYIDIPPKIPERDPEFAIPVLKRDENGEIP